MTKKNAVELVKNQKSLGFSTDYFWSPNPTTGGDPFWISKQSKPVPQGGNIQNGDTGNNKDLPPDRGVGDIYRVQRRLLPHPHSKPVQKIPAFSYPGPDLQIQSSTFWSFHSTYGIHGIGERGQTRGSLAKKKIMFLHSKNKASRKGYRGEC